ncbi:MAG: hypothetical protein JXQ71_01105 [Verrucomicrobia bacterium]|nr:hypothetical protein [Verrucomicrobiota bacterium]
MADGHYDFQFRLYDAPTHGFETVPPRFDEAVPVRAGLFQVELDSQTTGVDLTECIGRDRNTQVMVNDTLTVGSSLVADAGNNLTLSCAQDGLSSAGNKLIVTSAEELGLESGYASMVMKKNGDITIMNNP